MSTGTPTVAELVERYAPRLSPRGTSPRSATVARRHLIGIGGRVAQSLGIHPDELTIAHLSPAELAAAFRAWSLDRGPVSLRRSWRTWQRFLDVLVADGVVDHNPLQSHADVDADERVVDVTGSVVAVGTRREPPGLARSVASHPSHAVLRRYGIFVPG